MKNVVDTSRELAAVENPIEKPANGKEWKDSEPDDPVTILSVLSSLLLRGQT